MTTPKRTELCKQVDRADQVPFVMRWVQHVVEKALADGAVQVTLGRPAKSRSMEAKYHAMISDIRQQCFRGYSAEGVKAVLVNQFALEMAEMGEPLANPGEKVWDWKTQEPVYVRPSTTKFRKSEASAFIEFLHSVGAEYGVQWSEKALAVYDQYIQEKAA